MTVSPEGLCTLTIKPTNGNDAGVYTVEASNGSGSKRLQAGVTVIG